MPWEYEQKCKTWKGNEAKRPNKETVTTSETYKEGKTYRIPMKRKDSKKTTYDESANTTGTKISKDVGQGKKTQQVPEQS